MGVGQVRYLCDDCWQQIEFLKTPWCEICGTPLSLPRHSPQHRNLICTDCREQPPLYGKFRTIAFYEPTLREAIHLLKYNKKQIFAKHLIQLLQAHFPEDLANIAYDALIPIPLHSNRFRDRGFNQSEQIAQGVAQVWGIPIRTDILVRIRDTAPQSSLSSREERMKNTAGAFEIRLPYLIQDRKILLIDDIFTTGTTINEALKVLRTANPECVDVLTLTRTKPNSVKKD